MTRPHYKGLTIDPKGSEDLDDAVWVEKTLDGFVVRVSISDATAWVKIGSEADSKAHDRLTSRYYPNRTRHLLPNYIATDLASLLPGKPKKALTIVIRLKHNLEVTGDPRIRLSYVESRRLSYSDIPTILKDREHPLFRQVGLLASIAKELARGRGKSTPLPFYDLPKGFVVTEEGIPREIPANETIGHVIVREMMVLANSTLARFCRDVGVPILYRSHQLRRQVDPDLAHLVSQNGNGKLDFKKVNLVRAQMGIIVPRARYDTRPRQHAGLGLPVYTHGSSPLRRRADMIVHRQVKAWLGGGDYPYDLEDLEHIVDHINSRAEEMDESHAYLHRRWEPHIKVSQKPMEALASWAQKVGELKLPTYEITGVERNRRGQPIYICTCTMAKLKRSGTGRSRAEAKNAAARAVWNVLFAENR